MKNKKQDRKRMIASVVAIMLVLIMLLGTFLPMVARAEEISPIKIEAKIGTNDSYKIGKTTNVEVLLTNTGQDFVGELQVKTNVSKDPMVKEYNIYAYDIDLLAGSTQKHNLDVILYTINRDIIVNLVDKKEKVVSTTKVRAIPSSSQEIFVGVLTDEPSELDYLKNLSFFDTRVSADVKLGDNLSYIDIEKNDLSYGFFDNYAAIIINNFSTNNLAEHSMTALRDWVQNGGMLILGTGENQEKVLQNMGNYFSGIIYEEDVLVKSIYSQDLLFEIKSEDDILLAQFENYDLSQIQNSGDITASYLRIFGNGNMIVHGYDLGVAQIAENISTTTVLNELYAPYIYNNSSMNEQDYYNYNNSNSSYLANIDETKILLNVSYVVILIYILFLPFLYLILKAMDKREKGWVVIPVFSLSMIIIVVFITRGSVYHKPLVTTSTMLQINNGESEGTGQITGAAYSSEAGTINVDFGSDDKATIPFNGTNYYNGNSTQKVVTEKDLTKTKYGESTLLSYYEKARWGRNDFELSKNIQIDGYIEADIVIESGFFKGTIENNTDMYFDPLIFTYQGFYQNFGAIAPNATIDVDVKADVQSLPSFNSNDLAYQVFDYSNYNYNSNEYKMIELKRNLLSTYYNEKMGYGKYANVNAMSTTTTIKNGVTTTTTNASTQVAKSGTEIDNFEELNKFEIVAFSNESFIGDNFKINNKSAKSRSLNLIIVNGILVNNEKFIAVPFGMIKPEVISQGGVAVSNNGVNDTLEFYSTPNNIELQFILPKGKIYSFTINDIAASYRNNAINAEIYNSKTSVWDRLENGLQYRTDLTDYIKDNKILLQYTEYEDTILELPQISIELEKN